MSKAKNTGIGVLIDVTAEYFTARISSIAENPAAGSSNIGQVGSFLSISQFSRQILVTVERSYRVSNKQGQTVHMVRLVPLGELDSDGKFNKGVTQFPTSGSELRMVSNADLVNIFAMDSRTGFKVGHLTSLESVGVHLDASAFFGRHAAILGQSGSGKSWAVTSLIQSALKNMPKAHIILLDMHGEYCDKEVDDTIVRSPFPANKVRCLKAAELEFPYWLLSYAELCELIIDAGDENSTIQRSHLRSIIIGLKREANKHLDLGHITVDSPVYYSLNDLLVSIEKANNATSHFGNSKSPLNGKFDHVLVTLGSLLNDSRYDFLMKPALRVSTESLASLMSDLVGLGEPAAAVTVLDLSAVPFNVVPMVAAQIGRLIYEFNFWNPLCIEFPMFLICEEAHEYISRDNDPRYKGARLSMERIAKNGRKYGVGLCVVSQRPHDVSETVLAQCSSFICLRISNPDDQVYVRSMVPEVAQGTFAALTSLSKGEAIALGEAVPMPVRFKVKLPDPPPNSTDVDYAGKWSKGGTKINVEKLVRSWHRQLR